ncbi:MAG TPA: hypothetical protein VM008_09645 [Phycisphaerae bacterium]|nr:hypothetical protein [Phycisphaerae bacterium]
MNAKIVNLLERHLEKIVLAVAVAGAGFIAYSGMQPTTIPDPSNPSGTLSATGVEEKVSEAVQKLEDAKERTSKVSERDLTSSLKDYVAEYNNLMLRHPLSEALVATDIPRFAPIQASISAEGGPVGHLRLALPTVPSPKNVTAVADRGSVVPPPSDLNAASGAPPAQPLDKNWVCVSGSIPWKDYVDAYNSLSSDQKLAPADQHNVLYRIDVQRRTRTGNGWSDWQEVTPSAAGGARIPDIDWNTLSDTDWSTTVSQFDASFQRIAEPIFYYLAPKDPTQPPTPIIPPIIKTAPTTTAPAPGAAPIMPPPGAIPGHPPMPPHGAVPPGFHQDSRNPPVAAGTVVPDEPVNPVAPQPVPGLTVDVNTLKQQGDVPFWFWDETVDAGHDYQYRTSIIMYNPLFRYPNVQDLKDPGSAKIATVASNWFVVPGTVSVSGDLCFFVENNFGGGGSAQKVPFLIFKWTNGSWCRTNGPANVDLANHVAGQVHIPDSNRGVPVDTGFTLVDSQIGTGGDITATLLSPSGELITRNSNIDRQDPQRQKLLDLTKPIGKPRVLPTPGTPGGPPLPVNRPPAQHGNIPEENNP